MARHSAGRVTHEITRRFEFRGYSMVRGYARFEYVKRTKAAVTVLRQRGTLASVSFAALKRGVEAVREDPRIYSKGPNSLRPYGITHVTSVVWSLLHLLTLEELRT